MLATSGIFPHRMRIWRDTGQRDRYGQRDLQITQTELGLQGMTQTSTDVRCRISTAKGGQRFEERSTLVFVTTHTVYVEPNADINEADRVQIYEPIHQGVLIPDGIITLVRPAYALEQIHHLEVTIEVIRGSAEQGIS